MKKGKDLKTVKLNLFPPPRNIVKEGRKLRPVIYVHFYKNKVQYVGQTIDLYIGRPFRAGDSTYGKRYPVEYVRWIDASNDQGAREYWEAYLIAKFKPKKQNWRFYKRRVERIKKSVEINHKDKLRKQMRKRYYKPTKDFMKELKNEKR